MEYIEEKHRTDSERIKVGITHGDMNGVGYEIIMKTFHDQRMLESITPVVYGSSKVASYHRKSLNISEINFNLVKNAGADQIVEHPVDLARDQQLVAL